MFHLWSYIMPSLGHELFQGVSSLVSLKQWFCVGEQQFDSDLLINSNVNNVMLLTAARFADWIVRTTPHASIVQISMPVSRSPSPWAWFSMDSTSSSPTLTDPEGGDETPLETSSSTWEELLLLHTVWKLSESTVLPLLMLLQLSPTADSLLLWSFARTGFILSWTRSAESPLLPRGTPNSTAPPSSHIAPVAKLPTLPRPSSRLPTLFPKMRSTSLAKESFALWFRS